MAACCPQEQQSELHTETSAVAVRTEKETTKPLTVDVYREGLVRKGVTDRFHCSCMSVVFPFFFLTSHFMILNASFQTATKSSQCQRETPLQALCVHYVCLAQRKCVILHRFCVVMLNVTACFMQTSTPQHITLWIMAPPHTINNIFQ